MGDPTDRYPSAASATQRVPTGPGLLAAPGVAPALAPASSRPSPIGRRRRSARRRSSSSGVSAASGPAAGARSARRADRVRGAGPAVPTPRPGRPRAGAGVRLRDVHRVPVALGHDGRGMFRDRSTLSSWKIGVGSSPSAPAPGHRPGAPCAVPDAAPAVAGRRRERSRPRRRSPAAHPCRPPAGRAARALPTPTCCSRPVATRRLRRALSGRRHATPTLRPPRLLIHRPVAVAAEQPNDVGIWLPQRQPLERTWGPDPAETAIRPRHAEDPPAGCHSLECPGVSGGVPDARTSNGSRTQPRRAGVRHCGRGAQAPRSTSCDAW